MKIQCTSMLIIDRFDPFRNSLLQMGTYTDLNLLWYNIHFSQVGRKERVCQALHWHSIIVFRVYNFYFNYTCLLSKALFITILVLNGKKYNNGKI